MRIGQTAFQDALESEDNKPSCSTYGQANNLSLEPSDSEIEEQPSFHFNSSANICKNFLKEKLLGEDSSEEDKSINDELDANNLDDLTEEKLKFKNNNFITKKKILPLKAIMNC